MSVLERIAAAAARLDETDYYEILGVARDATGPAILDRYYALATRLHPNRFALCGNREQLQAVNRVAARIGEARRVLCDPTLRAEYDSGLAQGRMRLTEQDRNRKPRPKARQDPAKPLAQELYEQAQQLLELGAARQARRTLELARQYEPESEAIAELLCRLENSSQAQAPAAAPRSAPTATETQAPSAAPAPAEVTAPTPAGAPIARLKRRKHPRYPVTMPVALRLPSWQHVEVLFTRNLSKGGMFLKTRKTIPLHSQITLKVIAPSRDVVELSAEVVHVSPEDSARGPGVGLRFLDLSAQAQVKIDAILSRGAGLEAPATNGATLTLVPDQVDVPTREELVASLMRIRGRAAHDVLGVPADADRQTVELAYRRALQAYDPARVGMLEDASADVVKVLCAYLRYAYEELLRSVSLAAGAA